MQKAIRRQDAKTAGYFAMELFKSGYHEYVWKRLYIISAEDCAGLITQEIHALYMGFKKANEPKQKTLKGAVFACKAIIILCSAPKTRDADHLVCLVYDQGMIDQNEIDAMLNEPTEYKAIPDYAYDFHTQVGRKRGKTKSQFFHEEFNALSPRQKGLFDDLVTKA